jgi:farnesyl diphosphate synthase
VSGPDLGALCAMHLEESRRRVESWLERQLPRADAAPTTLHEAMRYAALGPGKRLRPALAYAAAHACGADPAVADPLAGALELVHAYSLVHDDLPAMDDDDERRGRPTVHVRWGEATAILVGDALQAEAFALLAAAGAPVEVIERLARAAGSRALVGGQADDLAFDPRSATPESVAGIHARKTAALFTCAAWGGGRLAGAPREALRDLERFGASYGAAFQLVDDLDDAGRDDEGASALAVESAEQVRARARAALAQARAGLERFGDKGARLAALAAALAARLP